MLLRPEAAIALIATYGYAALGAAGYTEGRTAVAGKLGSPVVSDLITLTDDGTDLTSGAIRLEPDPWDGPVSTGPRVGLRAAAERPWRFWSTGERSVSTYRPAAALRPRPAPRT